MDSAGNGSWDPNQILGVLAQGKEQTRQLEARLNEPSTVEMYKLLVQQISSTFQTAISIAENSRQLTGTKKRGSDSPQSAGDSPISGENSEWTEMFKKRKSMPKWSRQVRVRSGGGIEAPLEDGYSWRKYGQKDILGAKYPRGYYRCSYRNSVGCLATKQVQRSDEDASLFDVTYRGAHTCSENQKTILQGSVRPEEPKMQQNGNNDPQGLDLLQQLHQQDQQLLQSLRAKLTVETEDPNTVGKACDSSSFSFSFPSTSANCMDPPDRSVCSPSTLENCFLSTFSPPFVSAMTSESNYFNPMSSCQMSNYGGGPNLPAPEIGLADMISATTSLVNSPMVDMDFGLRHGEFEHDNFPFDGSNIF